MTDNPNPEINLRALLVDDHPIFREGVRNMLASNPLVTVIGEASDGEMAVQFVKDHATDLVIMDIQMPKLNGIDATRLITEAFPAIKVIALSMYVDKRFLSKMLDAGASAFMAKNGAFRELEFAIRSVAGDKKYISPEVSDIVVKEFVEQYHPNERRGSHLSPKESQILQLLAEGKSTKEIALGLSLSPKTVDTHRHRIMEKLHLSSIADLTKYAIREGITSLNS